MRTMKKTTQQRISTSLSPKSFTFLFSSLLISPNITLWKIQSM